jgi:hypothetical protein
MKNIIIFILTFAAFYTLVINPTTLLEKDLPANAPLIIKSNLPGTCRVSAITPAVNTKRNIPIVTCKVLLSAIY